MALKLLGVGFRAWGLEFKVWGLSGLGFRVFMGRRVRASLLQKRVFMGLNGIQHA